MKVLKPGIQNIGPLGALLVSLLLGVGEVAAQDVVSSQLRQGFGKNKVRYKDFDWHEVESEHLRLLYEPEFEDLADRAILFLEEAYDHISALMRHELSTKPPIVIFKSHYEFQQTNIIQAFLPPGVAGFAEPLRYRMVIPFDGDLDNFRNVLVHELMHIFQYDIVNRGPVKRITNPIARPPTWIMEGMAQFAEGEAGMGTIDEMVLRDAVLTDELIPLEVMDSSWDYLPNTFLAYKQGHSLMEYMAANYGPEKISRILRVWDSRTDTDKLLERLLDVDMKTLDERWQAHMRKKYWPLLQNRDYVSEFATRIVQDDDIHSLYAAPRWSLSGDMLAVLSTDGVEQHVDIIRLRNGTVVQRVTAGMRTAIFDDLTFGQGSVAWAPDGRTIAFVAKKGPKDLLLLWDLYNKEVTGTIVFEDLEVIRGLDWAPESRRLAFVGTGYGQSDIYFVDVDTRQLTQVTGTPTREDYPAWSPDGARIAFSAKRNGQFDIREYDVTTGRTRGLISSPTDDLWPQWLPEGNKMLFVSTRERINDLFVYHLETGREFRITRTISGVMSPALSPDGKQIVLGTYYHGRQELYRLDMPSWPEIKSRNAQFAARVSGPGRAVAASPQAASPEAPAAADTSTLAAVLRDAPLDGLADAAPPLLEQAASGQGKAVKLAEVSQPLDVVAGIPETPDSPEEAVSPAPASVGIQLDSSLSGDGTLALDELPRRRYTPRLEFDGVSFQMGYFNGFLSGIAQLSMSDLLGNHSLVMFTDYIGSREINNDFTFAVGYSYFGRRPTYSATIFNWNQYFNDPENRLFFFRGRLVRGLVRSRQGGLLTDATYPLDIYRRVELSYSFVDERRELVWPDTETIESFSTHLFKTAYIHDSLNNGLLGPTSGRKYYLSVGRTLVLTGGDRSFSHIEADYRHYIRLGRWSVLGLRGVGVGSLGRDGLTYNLGGPSWVLPFFPGYNLNVGPLRGYPFSQFTGSRVLLVNSEVRVPFIRNITFGWPGTFAIPAVDGSFFFDLGGTWNDGDTLDPWPLMPPDAPREEEGEPRKLRAGVGFGLLVYFLAPMNFEFARQTDMKDFSDWRMHFSFGKSF